MNQCEAILSTGPNAGSQCPNRTNETFCGVHKNFALDQMPVVALRNVFKYLDAESLKRLSETNRSLNNIAQGALASRRQKHNEAMAYLEANCDTGDLMERIHHLNDYKSYDPIGIVVSNKRSITTWKKGTNMITQMVVRSAGRPKMYYTWTNINGHHRIGGPAMTESWTTQAGNHAELYWYEDGVQLRHESIYPQLL